MGQRRKNVVTPRVEALSEDTVSLTVAKQLFLKEIRMLAKQTQRWHRENISAFERVLNAQGIEVSDCGQLTSELVKDHFVFYMRDELGLKANTINGRIRSVQKFSTYLVNEGYIHVDFGKSLSLVKGEREMIETFSLEQVKTLLRQPDKKTFTGYRDYVLMLLLLETGIRISEAMRITIRDIHLNEGRILVHGKGGKQRYVPIQRTMKRALQEYLSIRGMVETEHLFVTVNDTPLGIRHIQENITMYGAKAHIRHVRVSPHTFRHTMAKFYILAGGDVFTLQQILGHNSLETVRLYVSMFASDVQDQHKRFSFVEKHI